MKKTILLFIVLSFSIFSDTTVPKIEHIQGIKPWWIESHKTTQGVLEGIGIVSKDNENSSNLRVQAIEFAKREIAGIKKSYVESTLTLEENNNGKNLNIYTESSSSEDVSAKLIDTYEDSQNYYVWMAEFYDDSSKNDFIKFINSQNELTLKNKSEYIKYLNKVVVTHKKGTKFTVSGGLDKGFQKKEILDVYRLTEATLNPLTKEVNDFAKKKVGELTVEELFDNQALASADFLSTFKVKEGDIVVGTKVIKKDKELIKKEKIDNLETKYNYNMDYEPQVLDVERSKILGPKQYELSLMSDFKDLTNTQFRMGLLRFVEAAGGFSLGDKFLMNGQIKIAFPIGTNTNTGFIYKKVVGQDSSSIIALLELTLFDNMGIFDLNFNSPIGTGGNDETLGISMQLKPDKNVLIGAEYITNLDDLKDDSISLKLNLKMLEDTWIGGGVIRDDNTRYFIKISKIMIY